MWCKKLNEALENPQKVTRLIIKNKKLKELPQEMSSLQLLIHLEIISDGLEVLPDLTQALPHLRTLNLVTPKLKVDIKNIMSLESLENLKIKSANVEIPKKVNIPKSLKFLHLMSTSLKVLPKWIGEISTLETLVLSDNQIEDFPNSQDLFTNLRWLNLDRCKLEVFPQCFSALKNLNHLSIDGNKFSDSELSKIQELYKIWF